MYNLLLLSFSRDIIMWTFIWIHLYLIPNDVLCQLQVWFTFALWFCMSFLKSKISNDFVLACFYLPLKGALPFIWTTLNPFHLRMICIKLIGLLKQTDFCFYICKINFCYFAKRGWKAWFFTWITFTFFTWITFTQWNFVPNLIVVGQLVLET